MIDLLIKAISALLLLAIVCVLGAVLFAFPIKWLWNYVVPYLFRGAPEIDFWHAWALGVLSGMLFKSSSSSSSTSTSK